MGLPLLHGFAHSKDAENLHLLLLLDLLQHDGVAPLTKTGNASSSSRLWFWLGLRSFVVAVFRRGVEREPRVPQVVQLVLRAPTWVPGEVFLQKSWRIKLFPSTIWLTPSFSAGKKGVLGRRELPSQPLSGSQLASPLYRIGCTCLSALAPPPRSTSSPPAAVSIHPSTDLVASLFALPPKQRCHLFINGVLPGKAGYKAFLSSSHTASGCTWQGKECHLSKR